VGAAKYGVWLTESIFLIFGRGHIQIAHHPPVPTPALAFSPAPATQRSSVCRIFEWFKDTKCIQLKIKISSMNSMT